MATKNHAGNHAGNHPARVMRMLRTINEKLDVAISGHGKRIGKLEAGHTDHETRIGRLERAVRWLTRKAGGGDEIG